MSFSITNQRNNTRFATNAGETILDAARIASKWRGRCPCNVIYDEVYRQTLLIIKIRYIDFGSNFSHDKLTDFMISIYQWVLAKMDDREWVVAKKVAVEFAMFIVVNFVVVYPCKE